MRATRAMVCSCGATGCGNGPSFVQCHWNSIKCTVTVNPVTLATSVGTPTRDTGTRYLTPQPRLFAGRLRGWRRSRAASGELAPKNSLEVPDERLIAERAAGGLGSPERGGGGRRLGVGQKGRDVADPVQQRPCHDQPVILARQGDRYRVPVSSRALTTSAQRKD